jgi:hypothetical protein
MSARPPGRLTGHGHRHLAHVDVYEWSWTGSLTQWAPAEATAADQRREVLRIDAEHRTAWLDGYRGQLGFATVVFHDVAAM